MRVSKFRVWCTNKQEWEKDKIRITPDGIILRKFVMDGKWRDVSSSHIVDFCTGKQDRNGNDIYNSDILRAISMNSVERDYRFKIYVGVDGAFRYELQYSTGDKWKRSASQTVNSMVSDRAKEYYEVEIIGNVHEGVTDE